MRTNYNEFTYHFHGLSSDKKPILKPISNGSTFHEMDTGNDFYFDGATLTWIPKKEGGGGGGGEPDAYIKDAAVSGNTLTLTKKDGSKVKFTPEGGGGTEYSAGEGILIKDDAISIDKTVVALKSDKTNVVESSINGNVKVDSAEVQVYRLPKAYEDYLARATYKLPTINTLQILNSAGKSVSGNYEIGSTVEVASVKHKETESQNIAGKLTFNGMSINPTDTLATVAFTKVETLTSNKTYTMSGVSTLEDKLSKSVSVTFTEYAYSKLINSEDTPISGLTKESAISTFASSGNTFNYLTGQYLYLYTNAAGKKVKSEILGQ